MLSILRGINIPPRVVGIARGLVEAAVIGALGAVAVELQVLDWGDFAFAAPVAMFVVRWVESEADGIDPAKKRGV